MTRSSARPLLLAVFLAGLAGALGAVCSALADPGSSGRRFLPESADQTLPVLADRIVKKSPGGLQYLRKSGLQLVVVVPSVQQMLDFMRKAHAEGKVSDATLRQWEQRVRATPPEERYKAKYMRVGTGFEPKTALPRPYGSKTPDGRTVNVSEAFMRKFEVTTEYDLQRVIRNASIVLTNFNGDIKRDIFRNHHARLVQFFRGKKSSEYGLGESSTSRDVLLLTAAFMVVEQQFLSGRGAPLPAEDHFVAALIIGNHYRLY